MNQQQLNGEGNYMDQRQRKLLEQILEYVITNEEQHYEESGRPADHIYAQAYLLRQLVGGVKQ